MDIYIYISTVLFGLLFLSWSFENWVNISVRIILLSAFVAGMVFSLQQLGWIVKVV